MGYIAAIIFALAAGVVTHSIGLSAGQSILAICGMWLAIRLAQHAQ